MSIVEAEQQKAPVSVGVTVGEREITFEAGKLAKQADGAVVVRSGDTMVLATAQGRMETREGADFFPLTVDVEERMYAAGKIPGGFVKREGRPTGRAILTAGKAKWLDRDVNAQLEGEHGHTIWERIQSVGLREAGAVVEELLGQLSPPITMESGEDDIVRQIQVRSALTTLLEKQRLVAAEGAVREQFESDLRALTEAEQDSKELKSAKRNLLYDRIVEEVRLPFPVGQTMTLPDGTEQAVKDTMTRQYVRR